MKIKIICKQCDKEFKDYLSNKRKFCSKECLNGWQIGKSIKSKTGDYKDCLICRKKFYAPKWRQKRNPKYCSFKCSGFARKDKPLSMKHKKRIQNAVPKREKSHLWKGGKRITWSNYIQIYQPEHPNTDNRGYIREHRLVMEKYLGRYLKSSEVVHHVDGDTKNNNINNLMLFRSNAEHRAYHKNALFAIKS